jgi:two-component system, NtrC family, response regulator AtoC
VGLESLGVSTLMREVAEKVEQLAASPRTTVLLTGESGTGKGWVARLLHELSPRARRPFVEVNSAGLTPTFLASELFGHEKGAFTDATSSREGLFSEADGGTLFLDEVGELSLELQPRLLNVLETRRFRRLGGGREITSDVRFLTATNQDLRGRVEQKEFREDLFYRLNVAPLHLPPLRERSPEDLLALIHGLLHQLGSEIPGSSRELSDEALHLLLGYAWPGNVREMRNVLERALIFSAGAEGVKARHLPEVVRVQRAAGRRGVFAPEPLEAVERRHIERTLLHHRGNRTRSARDLGIARTTLIKKIEKYGLEL